MQFIANGPDIPDLLLEAQEEGRVVFFCGAGISYPAGLPSFKGLVDDIYATIGAGLSPIEQEAYDRGQYDATLGLLERRVPGQRLGVRNALAKVLVPNLKRKKAFSTHSALLQLARAPGGALRLVTTNFDRIFEHALKKSRQPTATFTAPMLPIPKNSRWNGLVYLHGLLPATFDDQALHRLVLTSGDFGLAYLTERWASRFVSELFRHYVVLFVGYSINDPVLRYMMDALAADRMLGEVTPQAYALADCAPGDEHKKRIEWEAKGVVPILCDPSASHAALHNTLQAWSDTWRDGVLGKERIVVSYAISRPSASTRQDDFVGRMLWALCDDSGLPARRFADFNPAPGLEWLEALGDRRYRHSDLRRFAIAASTQEDDKLRFSLLKRPSPYVRAPWMALVSDGGEECQWDEVMFQMARWLTRHLNDPALIIWLAQGGGQLHSRLPWLIDNQLDRISKFERERNTSALNELRANAPNAIPGRPMRILWRIMLSGSIKMPGRDFSLYRWKERFKREGLTPALRLTLRELLAPKVVIRRPYFSKDKDHAAALHVRDLVDWELVLADDHVHSSLRDLVDSEWTAALPALFDDFQLLLRDALDLLQEMGEADERSDRSHWDLPSISPHWQNRGFRDWVTLIELLRDSWLALRTLNPLQASQRARRWFELPYSTFKRLALFAAAHDGCIAGHEWVRWLTTGNAWWLWSSDTHREVMRLLAQQGQTLKPTVRQRLERAILAGPPRAMYVDDLETDRWQELVELSVWTRLAKLRESGIVLGSSARRFLALRPAWRTSTNERDEFLHWMSGTGDPDYDITHQVEPAPRRRSELVAWLQRPPKDRGPHYEDNWSQTCRERFFHGCLALRDLARQGYWPGNRWRQALQVWSRDGLERRSWSLVAPLIKSMPDATLQEVANSVALWLAATAKLNEIDQAAVVELCNRVLDLPIDSGTGILRNGVPIEDAVTDALNHPIGNITQAVTSLWFRQELNDGDKLPADIARFFSRLCDTRVDRFIHGRVLLASSLIALFRVDRAWTEEKLLPLFDWTNPSEATAVWQGFLWSPRLYRPLLLAMKRSILESSQHYGELGEYGRQFAAFLTYAALESIETYSTDDFRSAFGALPQVALEEAAQSLHQALDGSADQREDYWRNRVAPFWHKIWPKDRDLATPAMTESLVRLTIAAGMEFPSALACVEGWLLHPQHPDYAVHRLLSRISAVSFPSIPLNC